MPKWVNGFEKTPTKHQIYFVKYNGAKYLLRLDEFWRKIEMADTFFWLDESEETKETINGIKSIDDFAKADRALISKEILTPYAPKIRRNETMKTLRAYYQKELESIRKEVSSLCYVEDSKKINLLKKIKKILGK